MSDDLNLPQGCKQLYGTLYAVPFDCIVVPDDMESAGEYKFSNPRMLTEQGSADLFDKRLSSELRESIKTKTLLNPLVCRWVQQEEGINVPQLVGGDRRYRALDFLIRKKEIVTDPCSLHTNGDGEWTYKQVSADVAYATIPCQIFSVGSDLDALALSWAENKSRLDLTEGHEVAEVIKLRKFHATDEKILEILQRNEKWLAETDRLIANLDVDTLADLVESRMTRACALELCAIEDVGLRTKVREKANEAAQETCQKRIKRLQKQIDAALDQREIAEGSVADAEFHKDSDAIEAATIEVEAAQSKINRTVTERDSETPVATVNQVREAQGEKGKGKGKGKEGKPKILRASKIKEGMEYLDALIQNGGVCLDDTFTVDLSELKLARRIINNNILANEKDFKATIKRHADSKK